jgi:DNA helicase II / ATP-dependent DNA helicase PcrA
MAIEQIRQHILNKKNFLLSGGAGSGKTYTLMQVLDYVFEQNKNVKVACITYTNVAVNEIKERSPYSNLTVSTIHEFLWSQIKNYQKDLKKALIALIECRAINYSGEVTLSLDFFNDKKIEYQEYKKLENAIVSHDDIIKLAHYMFEHYLMLNSIVKDKFDFIFVDEYQDTQKEVTDIFLNFMQQGERKSILGFFGDSMQSIYDKRVENIDEYITQGVVERVVKADNRRCSTEVIRLINQIRNDGIVQEPANNNQVGSIRFLYSSSEMSVYDIKQNIIFENWNFSDTKNTKELYLTHKLIANEQGFRSLLDVFSNDDVTSDKPNKLISHLLRVEELIFLYENGFFNEFIRKNHFKIRKTF